MAKRIIALIFLVIGIYGLICGSPILCLLACVLAILTYALGD